MSPSQNIPINEALLDLHSMGYTNTAKKYNTSVGSIYRLAVAHGARVNEAKIQERKRERKIRQNQFLAEIINTTQKADVIDFLEGIPDNSINMHLTSFPYNLGKEYGGSRNIDAQDFYYYFGWCLQVLSQMTRTLAESGTLFLNLGSTRAIEGTLYPLDILLFDHIRQMGMTYQSRVIWEISHGLTPKNRLAERYETCLVFTKGEATVFNENAARIPQLQPEKRAFKGANKGQLSGHPLGAAPTNIWRIPNIGHNHPERKHSNHPAQFPEALAKRAVLLYSMPGQIVCDAFCGSGTTQVVSVESGRDFVGADLFYEDIRQKRLAEIAPDLVCDLPGVSDKSLAVWQAEAKRNDCPAKPISGQENARLVGDALTELQSDLFMAE